jgi:hypothetical protein
MTSHTHTQRPLVSDINSETWRLAITERAAQELRDYALYGPQPPPTPAQPPRGPLPVFTGQYPVILTSTPFPTWPPPRDLS